MTGFQILLLALVATGNVTTDNEKTHKTNIHSAQTRELNHGTYRSISPEDAHRIMRSTGYYAIIDVRTPEEYRAKRITGAINIPIETILEEPIANLTDFKQPIFVYCGGGGRSKRASQKLADIGYENVYEIGGIDDWRGSISR